MPCETEFNRVKPYPKLNAIYSPHVFYRTLLLMPISASASTYVSFKYRYCCHVKPSAVLEGTQALKIVS